MKQPSLRKCLFTLSAAFALSTASYAQISDCSIFLLGQKIEAGVNWNGALGASTAPPSGSHANWSTSLYNSGHCSGTLYTGTSLGVIADPDEDGWTAGATPFFGDFILPGGANEGWSLMFSGEQKNAWNTDAATHDSIDNVSAYLFDYSDTGGMRIAKTQANYNGIYVTQWIILDVTKLYMTVQVLIENTSLSSASDMYYLRTVNPHNDYSLTVNPSTWNKVLYNFPDTGNRAVATARGTTYNNAFMCMATKDSRAKAFVTKHAQLPNAVTLDYINAGDTGFLYNINDSVNINGSMGLIYDLGIMNSGGSAFLNFYYVFRLDVLEDALYSNHLGVNDLRSDIRQLAIYPDPVQQTFKVKGMMHGDKLMIFDITGRQVPFTALSDNEYSIETLVAGTYIGMVKNENGMVKGRIRLEKL